MRYSSELASRIGVIGLGNVLMSDDAFGPYVIQLLDAAYTFPENVLLRDLGTPSLDLITYIEDLDALIIVDAVYSDGEPGEMRTYRRAEILCQPLQPRVSPHEPGLKEALLMAEFDGCGPREALLVGVIPEKTETGVGLSPSVREALAQAVSEVIRELARLGVSASPRLHPQKPQIWWEGESSPREVNSQCTSSRSYSLS